MTHPARATTAYFCIYSKRDEVIDVTEESFEHYVRTHKCSVCHSPGPAWNDKPVPIPMEVEKEPMGIVVCIAQMQYLAHDDLIDALLPHLRGIVLGDAFVRERWGGTRKIPYKTCFAPLHLELEAERGKYCRHTRCRGTCGRFVNKVSWAGGAIVRRYLDGRRVYIDNFGQLFIEGRLADELDLRKRFPDLRLYKYDVIPEPLDGDIMPGDPGWTGEFHEQPLPKLPKDDKPKRGRWTLD